MKQIASQTDVESPVERREDSMNHEILNPKEDPHYRLTEPAHALEP